MNLYTIEQNFDYFEIDLQPFDIVDNFPDSIELERAVSFNEENLAIREYWPNLATEFFDNGQALKIPSLSRWIEGTLLLSPAAKVLASHFLAPFGEFLKITVNNDEWFIFNCLTFATPIESTASDQIKFNLMEIKDKVLFKAIIGGQLSFFCQERFLNFLQEYKLEGLQINNTFFDIDTGKQRTIEAA